MTVKIDGVKVVGFYVLLNKDADRTLFAPLK